MPRAAGLVDLDQAATTEADQWNDESKNIPHAKCFKLQKPHHIISALRNGFRIPVVLETLYDHATWEWAGTHKYLKDRDAPESILPRGLVRDIIKKNKTLEDYLDQDWEIYVHREFRPESKIPMAQHFAQKTNEEFRERLACLEPVVDDIVAYLFPEPEVGPTNEETAEQGGRIRNRWCRDDCGGPAHRWARFWSRQHYQ